MSLLEIEGLTVAFRRTGGGEVAVVEELSLALAPGEILGLVGESGCGKSVTARSILRLLPSPPARILAGSIRFAGQEVLALNAAALRALRGGSVAMVFQEPMTSLNPTLSIGFQIDEALRLHGMASRRQRRERVQELLRLVGIGAADWRLAQYPFELSGGLRQRVMIAIALANGPRLLIADEPTTALDVTIQAQILELLGQLRRELGMAILLISHDLQMVAEFCDRVAVMYAGRIVEEAPAQQLFEQPRHPYTAGLLAARPSLAGGRGRLVTIPGQVPPPGRRPAGCAFHTRCPRVLPRCAAERPPLEANVACWSPVP
jgi:oligopeptide/dipeptide ABC transporter ATP-binding protein